jgi:hypothetical protein
MSELLVVVVGLSLKEIKSNGGCYAEGSADKKINTIQLHKTHPSQRHTT